LLSLGTRLGTKVSSTLLLNLLSSILLLGLIGRGYYIRVELLIEANAVYNLGVT
jgi:hypothetical protein